MSRAWKKSSLRDCGAIEGSSSLRIPRSGLPCAPAVVPVWGLKIVRGFQRVRPSALRFSTCAYHVYKAVQREEIVMGYILQHVVGVLMLKQVGLN